MEVALRILRCFPADLIQSAGIALAIATGFSWLALLLKIRSKLSETERQLARMDDNGGARLSPNGRPGDEINSFDPKKSCNSLGIG
jgi:hypothetical protein